MTLTVRYRWLFCSQVTHLISRILYSLYCYSIDIIGLIQDVSVY